MAGTRNFRLGRIAKAQEFLRRFPMRSFLLQAGQALYSLTGYGVVLGAVEGFKADAVWGLLRGDPLRKVRVIGPPPSDLLGKAYRYLLQPAYHYWHGQELSYSDHWLLSAADAIATGFIHESTPLGDLSERWAIAQNSPVVEFGAWHPATRVVLAELGLDPDGAQAPMIPGLAAGATYGDTLEASILGFPRWVEAGRNDFPATTSATALAALITGAGRAVFDYLLDGDAGIVDEFDREELAIARMFEYGIFPPYPGTADQLELLAERSLELAESAGRGLPSADDTRAAVLEVFGDVAT